MTPSLNNDHHNKRSPPVITHASSSFPLFSQLPREIADQILLLACRLPPLKTTNHPPSTPSPLALDIHTTLNFLLVSKPIHTLVLPLLYTTIRITRPSALLELLETLEERPELGEKIRHLHVGDEDTLRCREGDWPLVLEDKGEDGRRVEEPALWLRTSWGADDGDGEKLPRWCEPGRKWCLESETRIDCKGAAVRRAAVKGAIERALQEVDLQPYRRGYARSGKNIGAERWAKRIFEVQACLDLYLAEMRRIEDSRGDIIQVAPRPPDDPAGRPSGEGRHYPNLAISSQADVSASNKSKEAEEEATDVFTVTRHQIWNHLTRRGAVLDQFDHPIRFAKAGYHLGHINIPATSVIKSLLAGPHPTYFTPEQSDYPFPESDIFEDEWPYPEEAKGKSSGIPLFPPYAVTGLGRAVGRLLVLASRAINVSLGGYLYTIPIAAQPNFGASLRSFCLGPVLPFWSFGAFSFQEVGPTLETVESLRIVGADLSEEEADRIAGGGERALKSLKRFQWELVQSVDPQEEPSTSVEAIYDTIRRLQGQQPQQESGKTSPASDFRLIEVRLHPSHLVSVLALAPPHVRTAWLNGSALRSDDGSTATPHRVKVVESEAAAAALAGKDGEKAKQRGIRMLHEGSRRWWEECAALELGERRVKCGEGWMPSASGGLGGEEQG